MVKKIYILHLITLIKHTYNLYIRNLKYAYLTPIFRLQNIHLMFSTCPHKYKWILCTEKPVLNASFQDFNVQKQITI